MLFPKPEKAGKLDNPCVRSRGQEGRKPMTHKRSNSKLTVSLCSYPYRRILYDGVVNRTKISFLVDTGSAVTLIRKDVRKKIQSSVTQSHEVQPL